MKLGTSRNPKFKRLARLTGDGIAATIGRLELLWQFTSEHSPQGDVGRWSNEEIEEELDWNGEPGALVAALVDSGWLDRCAQHRLLIHDWADHAPEYLRKRLSRSNLAFLAPLPPPSDDEECPEGEDPADSADDGGQRQTTADNGCPPSHAQPGQAESNQAEAGESEGEAPSAPAADAAPVSTPKGQIPKPESFDGPEREQIRKWASAKGWGPDVLNASLERFREWEPLKRPRRTPKQWVSAFQRITRESVEAGRIVPRGTEKPKGQAYADADEMLARRRREYEAEMARSEPEDPEEIGRVIDMSLRAASGEA